MEEFKSQYAGVTYNQSKESWESIIYITGSRIHLGYSRSELHCGKMYINALVNTHKYIDDDKAFVSYIKDLV